VLMFQAWLEQQKSRTEADSDFPAESVQIPKTSGVASAHPSAT